MFLNSTLHFDINMVQTRNKRSRASTSSHARKHARIIDSDDDSDTFSDMSDFIVPDDHVDSIDVDVDDSEIDIDQLLDTMESEVPETTNRTAYDDFVSYLDCEKSIENVPFFNHVRNTKLIPALTRNQNLSSKTETLIRFVITQPQSIVIDPIETKCDMCGLTRILRHIFFSREEHVMVGCCCAARMSACQMVLDHLKSARIQHVDARNRLNVTNVVSDLSSIISRLKEGNISSTDDLREALEKFQSGDYDGCNAEELWAEYVDFTDHIVDHPCTKCRS